MCLLRKHGTYLSCFSQHPCFVSIPMFSSVTSLKHLAVTIGCEEKGEKNACAKKKCMETATCNGTRVHMHVQLLRFAFLCANPLSDAKRTGSTEIHCVTAKTGSVHSTAQSKHEDAKHNQTTLTKKAPRCKTRIIATLNSKVSWWDSDCKVWFFK